MKVKTFLFSIFMIIPIWVFGGIGGIGGITNSRTDIEMGGHTIRPQDGGEEVVNISCYYQNGYICIDFIEGEGVGNLKITNLNNEDILRTSFFTYQPYSYYVGTSNGTYYIEVSTSVGHEYSGTLVIP